jgi:hypothetical protein
MTGCKPSTNRGDNTVTDSMRRSTQCYLSVENPAASTIPHTSCNNTVQAPTTGVMYHIPATRRSAYCSAYLCITVLLLVTAMVSLTIAFRSARSA